MSLISKINDAFVQLTQLVKLNSRAIDKRVRFDSAQTLSTTEQQQARQNIGVSATQVSGIVPIDSGGTGANTASQAITNLGLGTVATQNTVAIANGGTGATTAERARINLGLGTAAAANLTTSNSDGTAGRVLKVGDFGLGSVAQQVRIPDTTLPRSLPGGFFLYNDGTPNRPSKMSIGDVFGLVVPRQSGSAGGALWFPYNVASSSKQICYQSFLGVAAPLEYYFYTDQNMPNEDITVKSLKSGTASYKKGWRKLTATLPSQAGEVTLAHGVTTVETVQAKVINSDNVTVFNNDIDPTNQFYVRVIGANLVLGVTANSTRVFGKQVTIYLGEEL